jgi:spermidine synthase
MNEPASLIASQEFVASRADANAAASKLPFGLLLALFVVSGGTGLVDQLCFSKYLGYIVGATAHAVSAVLAAFMTGLALGAHLGGKWSSRVRRPLVAYGVLELVVALAVVAAPLGFRALTPLYADLAREAPDSFVLLTVLRWFTALALVVVPTTAMGATLPFLSRALDASGPDAASESSQLAEQPKTSRLTASRLTALYAANTFGGASGALFTAYWIVPTLGIDGTLFASGVASALVGAIAAYCGRDFVVAASSSETSKRGPTNAPGVSPLERGKEPSEVGAERTIGRGDRARLGTLAFMSGALVLAAEVVFTHLLSLIIGNSAYAFGLILAAFLSALFFGARLSRRVELRFGSAALASGLLATALAVLGTLPVWDDLPQLFAVSGRVFTTFEGREFVRGLTAFLVLLVPTSLMGLTFPLLLSRVSDYSGIGSWVGKLTALNTVGAVAGALAMGYVVLPLLGSQASLATIGLGFGLSALATWTWTSSRVRQLTLGGVVAAIGLWIVGPRWNLIDLTSGANVYFESHQPITGLVSIREDVHGGVTTVAETNGLYTLYTNGKFQGNNGWEMNAQRFFAHYPSMFVRNFEQTLVIGLGTGTTLGTVATYPWKSIDVVEISPAIVDAARDYFAGPNRGSLDDPRVNLSLADGRNFLLVSDRKYDLISMELSSIWFAGASSLYSDEFYQLVSERMASNGVFQQWVQLHHMYKKDFATIVHTLRKNFEHVALFYGGGQGILVASNAPLRASKQRLRELQARPNLREVLPFERPLEGLLDDVLLLDAGLDRFLSQTASEAREPLSTWVSTDENLYLEYATPRGNVLPWNSREALVADLRTFREPERVAEMLVE